PKRLLSCQLSLLLVIGGAGVLGALARYAVSRALPAQAGHFPWATFWTNVSGSVLVGLSLVLLAERFPHVRFARPLLITGLIGAYTTFSTYTVETDLLLRDGHVATGLAYCLGSCLAGLTAVIGGTALARAALSIAGTLRRRAA
ncbi:MAG: fluoride efflux transporter FluC, partial [Acidimicrobiales bacterium]